MPNEELSNYIKQARESGMTDDDIRRELLASGWSSADIDIGSHIQGESAKLIRPKQLLHSALTKLGEKYSQVFRLMIIPTIVGVVGAVMFISDNPILILSGLVLTVISAVFIVLATISLVSIFGSREFPTIADYLKSSQQRFWPYVWILALSGFIVTGGFFLFIIPGILLSVWFSVAIYAFILEDRRGMEALMRSKQLISGKFWKTWGRILFIGLVGVIINIPFQVIDWFTGIPFISPAFNLLVTLPISVAFFALFFQNLIRVKPEPFVYDKKSARKFVIAGLAGIGLFLALLTFGGYYFFTKLLPMFQVPTTTLTNNETANWQTYRNEEYGFEFRYPGDMVAESVVDQTDGQIPDVTEFGYANENGQYVGGGTRILIWKDVITDLQSWVKNHEKINENEINETGVIAGISAIVIKSDVRPTDGPAIRFKKYFLKKGSNIFEFMEFAYLENNPDQAITDFDKVLSTFKFIDNDVPGSGGVGCDIYVPCNSYKWCVESGHPIIETNPPKCKAPGDLIFTQYDYCIQVITSARNPQAGEIRDFPTPCDVPEGWEKI